MYYKYGHPASKYYKRFDHAFNIDESPQALATMKISDSEDWYPDTGATAHVTNSTQNL